MESNLHPVDVKTTGLYGYIEAQLNGDGGLDPQGSHRAQMAFWVENLESGNDLRDVEMLRRMEAKAHPSIEWVVKKVVVQDGHCRASCEVTVCGRTRPFEGRFKMSFAGARITVEGDHVFDMRDFGITPPRFFWLWIEPHVKVGVRIVAKMVGTNT
jgi:YceI-like domain